MVKKILHMAACLCLGITMLLGIVQPVWAVDSGQNSRLISQWLNQIRLDPLSHAEGLGYNRTVLLETFPWLGQFANGIEPFILSEFLNQKAVYRNDDFLDDMMTAEPVPNMNTDFAFSGDIGGVISLETVMDMETAVKIVINHQFSEELDPGYEGERYILSKVYNRLGGAIRWGKVVPFETDPGDACFISICFASSQLRSEVQVVNMINQIRAKKITVNPSLAENAAFLSGGLQPLFLNDSLGLLSWALLKDIDSSGDANSFGFTDSEVAASSVIEKFPKTDPNLYALWSFYSLVLKNPQRHPLNNGIFNPKFNVIGAAVYYVNGEGHDFLKLTLASGFVENRDPEISRIYGVIFFDGDQNQAYTPGEGVPDRIVTAFDKQGLKICTAVTNNAGQFTMYLPGQVEYTLQTGIGETFAGKDIYLDSDRYFDLIVNQKN